MSECLSQTGNIVITGGNWVCTKLGSASDTYLFAFILGILLGGFATFFAFEVYNYLKKRSSVLESGAVR